MQFEWLDSLKPDLYSHGGTPTCYTRYLLDTGCLLNSHYECIRMVLSRCRTMPSTHIETDAF